jgi:hypothetical protein
MPALPLGFERRKEQEESTTGISVERRGVYLSILAMIQIALYQSAVDTAIAESNYGGCVSRSIIKPGRPWVNPSPFNNHTNAWFIVGLGRDFLSNDNHQEALLLPMTILLDSWPIWITPPTR